MFNKQMRKFKYYFLRLLRIQDHTHRIALGFATGSMINFIPSFGLGPFLSTVCAKLLKGNTFAGFIGGILFLWAFPLMFYLNIVVGEAILPIDVEKKIEIIVEELEVGSVEKEVVIIQAGLKIGKAFFVGMVVNMICFGVVCYFVMYYLMKRYRRNILKYLNKNFSISRKK